MGRQRGSYHDARDRWRDSSLEELESVICNLLRCCSLLALCSWSYHTWFKENSLEHDIILGQVEEDLSPDFLRDIKGHLDAVIPIEEDLWLHDWDQSIVLQTEVTAIRVSVGFKSISCIKFRASSDAIWMKIKVMSMLRLRL